MKLKNKFSVRLFVLVVMCLLLMSFPLAGTAFAAGQDNDLTGLLEGVTSLPGTANILASVGSVGNVVDETGLLKITDNGLPGGVTNLLGTSNILGTVGSVGNVVGGLTDNGLLEGVTSLPGTSNILGTVGNVDNVVGETELLKGLTDSGLLGDTLGTVVNTEESGLLGELGGTVGGLLGGVGHLVGDVTESVGDLLGGVETTVTNLLGQSKTTVVKGKHKVVVVFKVGDNHYYINGKVGQMDVAPYIKHDRCYLPARFVAYSLGVDPDHVTWNLEARTATFTKGGTTVRTTIGDNFIYVNNGKVVTNAPTELVVPGRTMVPYRFIAEAFGATVSWNGNTETVTVEYYE